MSQKVEIVCDRCGNEMSRYYDIKNTSAKIQLWAVGEMRSSAGQRIDLCEECYEKFVDFLDRSEG